MKRLTVAAIAVATLTPGVAHANSPRPDPEPTIDFVLELGPGEDTDHWVDYALSEAGVPSRERPGRVVYTYEEAINGAWLKLTPKEAQIIGGLQANGAIVAASRAWDMDVQWFGDDVIVAGTDGRVPAWPHEVVPAGIERIDATTDQDFSEFHVGIIDTGVDQFHSDLNVVGGYDCTHSGHPDEWGIDENGHGTHTAGTVGALNNDFGVVGVAPGASIHAYKVLGADGSGSYAAVLCGIDRAMIDEVDVANMSLGGTNVQTTCGSFDSLRNAACNAHESGLIIVVAAGNSGENANGHSPANFGDSVITVSAIADWDGEPGAKGVPQFGIMSYPQEDDALAFFSSDGALVDVAAPGVGVLSTYPGDRFAVSSGTSMSTPAVSGSVVRALACGMTAEELLDYSADYNSAWTGDVDGFHEPLVIIPEGC